MSPTHDPNIWYLVFENTPPALRWLLGVLSCGLFLLARHVWKRNMERLHVIEQSQKQFATNGRIDKLENSMNEGLKTIHGRMDDLMLEIVKSRG